MLHATTAATEPRLFLLARVFCAWGEHYGVVPPHNVRERARVVASLRRDGYHACAEMTAALPMRFVRSRIERSQN